MRMVIKWKGRFTHSNVLRTHSRLTPKGEFLFCFIVSITRTQIPQSQNQTIKSMKTNHLLTVIVLIFVGTSCSSTKTTTTQSSSTTKTNTETRVSAINQSKIAEEPLTVSKPPKVRPYIDQH